MRTPSWVWRTEAIVHTSPVIDDEGNVYYTETHGRIVSLTHDGTLRWVHRADSGPGIPALLGDALFCFAAEGIAFSLALDTGNLRWRTKTGQAAPLDSAATVVAGGLVIVPTTVGFRLHDGNCDVAALNASTGELRWVYSLCEMWPLPSFNMLPAVVGSSVLVHDKTGGMHSVALETGQRLWATAGPSPQTFSTGALAAGPAGLVYNTFNHEGVCDLGRGTVRALYLESGEIAWSRAFEIGVNAGPAVGLVGGQLAVVVAVGDNFQPPIPPGVSEPWMPSLFKSFFLDGFRFKGEVWALKALTGEVIWRVEMEEKRGWSYNGVERGCLPDAFGNPSIGADGTVYVNWSKGQSMAVRDANGDGVIDRNDPREVTMYEHGAGTNGQTAIAPGMVVAPSCDFIMAWKST